MSLIRLEVVEAIYLFQRETLLKEKKNYSRQITQQLKRYTATRGEEYKCVVPCIACLLITLLSLIPIMSGAGLCSDSVTGMTAGLVLIRNDHRPGYKHTHTHTPSSPNVHGQAHARLCHLGLQS